MILTVNTVCTKDTVKYVQIILLMPRNLSNIPGYFKHSQGLIRSMVFKMYVFGAGCVKGVLLKRWISEKSKQVCMMYKQTS